MFIMTDVLLKTRAFRQGGMCKRFWNL